MKTFTRYFTHLIFAALLAFSSSAQVSTFQKTFGGDRMDYGHALAKTADGGFMLAGQTFSYGDTTSDSWLIKTDAFGNQQWMQSMGSDTLDGANSVVQTSDGGYFVVNHTEGYGAGDCDAWLYKTDRFGNILWNQTYGGPGDDVGEDGIETSSGDFVATGLETMSDYRGNIFIAKYTSAGAPIWIKSYGTSDGERGMRILETMDGGYAVAGIVYDSAGVVKDICVLRTDSAGNMLWLKQYGGAGREGAYGFCASADGGFVISGTSSSFGSGDEDAYLLCISPDGTQQWSRNYGGLKNDGVYSVASTSDGGYIAAGATYSYSDSVDMLIIKTDQFGNQQWMKVIGTPGYLTGANWLVTCDDGGFAIVGNVQPVNSSNGQLLFLKTDSNGNTSNINEENPVSHELSVFPDPAEKNIHISYAGMQNASIQILNSIGEVVYRGAGNNDISVQHFSAGLYVLTVYDNGRMLAKRFIKE